MCPAFRRQCAFVVRTENVEDSPLSIQRSRSAGGGQKPRRRSAEREGSHSNNDGNPLVDGRLTVRRMRRVDWTDEHTCDQVEEAIVCFRVPVPRDAGGFNEPNKTVNKFYLHGTNSVLEGLRYCWGFHLSWL
jgi:hypothetical protein